MSTADLSKIPGCPIEKLVKFLAKEWTAHIMWVLGRHDDVRFGALRRALPGSVSARVLSARLKELEHLGLLCRIDAGTATELNVSYRLTESGRHLDLALLNMELYTETLPPTSTARLIK